jgi:hypothetical protein
VIAVNDHAPLFWQRQSVAPEQFSYAFCQLDSLPWMVDERRVINYSIEATEEAIYNSMFKATTTSSNGHTVEALPIDKTVEILKAHRAIK